MSYTRQPVCTTGDIPTKALGPFVIDEIHTQDCIAALKQMPAASVDVAIADPPYNLSKGGAWQWDNSVPTPGFGGSWAKVMADWDNMPLADYFNFTLAWLSEIKRVVRPTGSFWVHGTYHNIGIINTALQLLEIEIINEVVWFKRNSFPNLSGRRLTASHETILWAHTGSPQERRYYFDYDQAKASACPEDGLKEAGKQMRTVWDIPNNKKKEEISFGKHPTQKPVRLIKRMLSISARPGDLLLVPFAGAGSDCVAAKELGIHFLAFDNDAGYTDIAANRLAYTVTGASKRLFEGKNSTSYADNKLRKSVPSLIKWTGSKRSQSCAIAGLMPPHSRYIEPFLGGGSVLYFAAVPGAIASDAYAPLIALWRLIQSEPETVVENYSRQWEILSRELNRIESGGVQSARGVPEYYYFVRDRFNETGNPLDLNFLTRTCVNGIIRFNNRGEFNNSFHLSRRGMTPSRFQQVVEAWHPVIQGVEFICQDYTQALASTEVGDFVYLDPPYAGSRQRYTQDLDLYALFDQLEILNLKGVKWVLSFDGKRGCRDLTQPVPESLFVRRLLLSSGNSPVNKVLNGPVEQVQESLYLNY